MHSFFHGCMQLRRQVARNMLPLGPGLRLGVMFFTQMYMHFHLSKVFLRDGQMCVVSRWEARIAEGELVDIRHYATTSSPINLDLPELVGIISLQQLILEWRARNHPVEH